VDLAAKSYTSAWRLVTCPLGLFLVDFDQSADHLLNRHVGFLNRCLEEVDLEMKCGSALEAHGFGSRIFDRCV
jgi:hypothetical protein